MSEPCAQTDLVYAYAVRALPAADVVGIEDHLGSCEHCRKELETLKPVVDTFVDWPTDVLRPPTGSLQDRLAERIAADTKTAVVKPPARTWVEPEWQKVAPGIEVKLLAQDRERKYISMLVRLEPNASYPSHTHAGIEELHLLEGELWIDDRKLFPGDYNRGEPGGGDKRVWSETGCTCVLMTSTEDVLG